MLGLVVSAGAKSDAVGSSSWLSVVVRWWAGVVQCQRGPRTAMGRSRALACEAQAHHTRQVVRRSPSHVSSAGFTHVVVFAAGVHDWK